MSPFWDLSPCPVLFGIGFPVFQQPLQLTLCFRRAGGVGAIFGSQDPKILESVWSSKSQTLIQIELHQSPNCQPLPPSQSKEFRDSKA